MRILIADDHAALRRGLMQILAEDIDHVQFGEAASTPETLSRLSNSRWDVLVLDIFMPGRGGLEVLRDVRRQHPDLPVLVLSSAPEEQMAIRVLKAGASGYLNKQAAPEELVAAVRKVLGGGRYVSAAMAERLAAQLGREEGPPHEILSDREYGVLRMLAAGKSIKEVATELSLSPKTVSTYHTRIWQKLRVHNDAAMVRYALEHGLAEGAALRGAEPEAIRPPRDEQGPMAKAGGHPHR
jgi:two-component system, NarL family, invasion response regulator UvrY